MPAHVDELYIIADNTAIVSVATAFVPNEHETMLQQDFDEFFIRAFQAGHGMGKLA